MFVISTDMVQHIKEVTETDRTPQEIKNYTLKGWPQSNKQVSSEVEPFFTYREDITIQAYY